jgi:hypothetical protein
MSPQQPQDQSTAPAPVGNSDPNYNFIFNNQQHAKKHFSLPGGSNPFKIAALVAIAGAVLGVLIIILSNIFGPKINTKQITDVAAHGQEISRVSILVSQKSRDLNTANLAATTSTVITSQQQQLFNYLKKNKKNVAVKDVGIYLNKKTDADIQSAEQNNRLSEYYYSYLKKNLTDYQSAVKTAYDTASGPNLRSNLQEFYLSTKTILSAQQLASVTGL